jgi:hypothetical protein
MLPPDYNNSGIPNEAKKYMKNLITFPIMNSQFQEFHKFHEFQEFTDGGASIFKSSQKLALIGTSVNYI